MLFCCLLESTWRTGMTRKVRAQGRDAGSTAAVRLITERLSLTSELATPIEPLEMLRGPDFCANATPGTNVSRHLLNRADTMRSPSGLIIIFAYYFPTDEK